MATPLPDTLEGLAQALLNPWQHGFPLQPAPFDALAAGLGWPVAAVLRGCDRLQQAGLLGRIGGVFSPRAGGASTLAAMVVPAERLEAVAAQVSAFEGINHNYEREAPGPRDPNLWFVAAAPDAAALAGMLLAIEAATGLAVLRLPLQRPYRIDLGFDMGRDLRAATAGPLARSARSARPAGREPRRALVPLDAAQASLAALAEAGLPLIERPFDAWAQALGWPVERVLATLQAWLDEGRLHRFGAVVRHHELGYVANAMTVFQVHEAELDRCGQALAAQPGVTLAYARATAPGWPYNLYCMVHGRDRAAVQAVLARAIAEGGLADWPRAVLFSRRRFKQTGARRFRFQAAAGLLSHTPAREATC